MHTPIADKLALDMYTRMVGIRKFEERIRYLFLEGIMPGTIHQYDGQEACAVGVCFALQEGDMIASTHRPHGHAIAKGLSFQEILCELFGKTNGCAAGKGGSMHIGNIQKGMLPAIAIVAGNIPIATGMALAFKLKKENKVAVSFFGDGATSEGAFHEALRLAAMHHLPCIYVCENNLYGASTPISMVLHTKSIAHIADAYGIANAQADGNDVFAVYEAAIKAIAYTRAGNGPFFLELQTYRRCGHSRRDAKEYMDKQEQTYWMQRDPIVLCKEKLLRKGVCTQTQAEEIERNIMDEINQAVHYAMHSPDPLPEDTLQDVFA